jgi:AraC family transcriptional regulator
LDDSKVRDCHGFTGAVVEHLRLSGAHVARIMHPPGQRIDAHGHDWPGLSLYRMGAYEEMAEDGASAALGGPSVVFQPSGAAHADRIGAAGLETLTMTFDPDWLAPDARRVLPQRTSWRPGGPLAFAARRLAEVWLSSQDDRTLRSATSAFLLVMFARSQTPAQPRWLGEVDEALGLSTPTALIARRLKRHPAWLARAYRACRGEGLGDTLRRKRVEQATLRLRAGGAPLADVAAECGFCDQSHMNRSFRAVLGRTPLQVRDEAALVNAVAAVE